MVMSKKTRLRAFLLASSVLMLLVRLGELKLRVGLRTGRRGAGCARAGKLESKGGQLKM